MQKLSFKFDISEEGKVKKIYQKQYFDDFLKQFAGKSVKVTVEKWKKQRSLNQNAYYHGSLIVQVIDALVNSGYPRSELSAEIVHDMLKAKFLKKDIVNEQTGEVLRVIVSTSSLTTTEFMDYIDDIARWMAEYLNTVLILPNEQSTLNFE
jgi:polyhydroxyalkanoate synthesis regulator phasin